MKCLAGLLFVVLALAGDAAQAQVAVPLVTYLVHGSEPNTRGQVESFRDGMRQLGHVEGRSFRLELRWSDGQVERLPELARELLRLNPHIAVGTPVVAVQAFWRMTKTLPIVMAGGAGALQTGLIDSLSHPGGNVTGVTNQGDDLTQKLFELLQELAPGARRVLALSSGHAVVEAAVRRAARRAAAALDMTLIHVWAESPAEIAALPVTCRRESCEALMALLDPTITNMREQLVGAVRDLRLPAVYYSTAFVEAGGLAAYSADASALSGRAAWYVDRILKGARPADLPVEQPTRFNLSINLRAAESLGLTVPPSLLIRADEVIE